MIPKKYFCHTVMRTNAEKVGTVRSGIVEGKRPNLILKQFKDLE